MTQLGFYVNAEKCLGCFTCAMSCKNMYHQPSEVTWRKLYDLKDPIYPHAFRGFYSLTCNHCETPACLSACPVGAYSKRDLDGVVIHDQDKCIGCGNCIRSCPFGAPQYNETLKKAEKCSFCWQRLDQNLEPACVLSCPVKAIEVIDVSVIKSSYRVQFPEGFPISKKLNPSIRFNLPETPARVFMISSGRTNHETG